MVKPALGRGLGALMGGVASPAKTPPINESQPVLFKADDVIRIPVAEIRPCAFQPRKTFSEESIKELADSIRQHGILTPLMVRRNGVGFELIAGERRWRAAQVAGLADVPAQIREADDRKVLELALIENLQREDLNPIEEALGYAQLAGQFKLTQDDIALHMGKTRSSVSNSIRLLQLPPDVQGYLRKGLLSVGHAKLIIGLMSGIEQELAAREAITSGMSVRALEEWLGDRRISSKRAAELPFKSGSQGSGFTTDAHVTAMQQRLQQRLGTKVLLRYRKGKGAVEIRFFNDDDLERILNLLGVPAE